MTTTTRTTLATAMLVAAATATQAQPVYRCGSTYSQTPCAGATTVTADDERSKAQAKQSSEVARRDMKLANEMEKSRLKAESRAAPPVLPASSAEKADKEPKVKPVSTKKPKKPDGWGAVSAPKPGEGKRKKS